MTLLKALQQMTAYASAYKGRFPDSVRDADLKAAREAIAKAEQDQDMANPYDTVLEALRTLEDYASKALAEITDQDTGWFYQLQSRAQKARAIIAKIDSVTP